MDLSQLQASMVNCINLDFLVLLLERILTTEITLLTCTIII